MYKILDLQDIVVSGDETGMYGLSFTLESNHINPIIFQEGDNETYKYDNLYLLIHQFL
jgi:hypothetical protein